MSARSIAERLRDVRERIVRAAEASGRDPLSIRLVAVSKFQTTDAIRAAYEAGQRDFGENYAQELVAKARALEDLPDLRLRFIGGLQSRKAKLLGQVGCAVETLTSAAAARALSERAAERGERREVMIQVNVSGEAQKSGVAPSEVAELASAIRALPSLHLTGLMTIPPVGDHETAIAVYRALSRLARSLSLPDLSMGMSGDFEAAIREGATSVRVGTAIFGARPAHSA